MNHEVSGHEGQRHGGQPNKSVRDPVCGMNVDPKSTLHTDSFAGQSYFFCSQHCLAKFQSEPKRYVQPQPASSGEARPSTEATKGEYTCPMHPEVRQLGPGTCPTCGMALEPVTPPAATRTEYVCPMHPEIVRSEPGSCPICGMALEPKTISAGDEPNPELADMKRRFWVSVALTIPVVIAAMGDMIPGQPLQQLASKRTWTWFELILSSPVILWGGWPFFV
ncbi:YHS domain-containing protein, partial [Nitrospirales bacterium NOB]|nr:YHS domain-containing protein [Nitrospirales bacterium NOB]